MGAGPLLIAHDCASRRLGAGPFLIARILMWSVASVILAFPQQPARFVGAFGVCGAQQLVWRRRLPLLSVFAGSERG